MPGFVSDSPLARDLIRSARRRSSARPTPSSATTSRGITSSTDREVDLSFEELSSYFASLREAFISLRIVREQIIVDGNFLRRAPRFRRLHRRVHLLAHRPSRAPQPTPRVGGDRHVQAPRRWAAGRGVVADRLPQALDQARRDRDGVRPPRTLTTQTVRGAIGLESRCQRTPHRHHQSSDRNPHPSCGAPPRR